MLKKDIPLKRVASPFLLCVRFPNDSAKGKKHSLVHNAIHKFGESLCTVCAECRNSV